MKQITPADYPGCPGAGKPYDKAATTQQHLSLALAICPECGRKAGITRGGKLRRHASAEWWARNHKQVTA